MNRLRTLGALDLVDPSGMGVRTVLAQPKRVALLVYLALAAPRGSPRRDSLIALFWPEQDEHHARGALNQAVHFLRRTLGVESIVARNGAELAVSRETLWCDAVAFEDELDAGHLAAAVELYRGDLLEGFHVTGAPGFERWLADERARLEGRYLRAIEQMAEECDARGDVGRAVELWRTLAARDPLSSRVTLRLMRALVAAGDSSAAIQHARVHDVLLREELGVPPDPHVRALVRDLQSLPPQGAERDPDPPSPPAASSSPSAVSAMETDDASAESAPVASPARSPRGVFDRALAGVLAVAMMIGLAYLAITNVRRADAQPETRWMSFPCCPSFR